MWSSSSACQISDQMSILPTSFSHRKLWEGEWEGGAEKAAGRPEAYSPPAHPAGHTQLLPDGSPHPSSGIPFLSSPSTVNPATRAARICTVSAVATRTVTVTHFLSTGSGKAQEHSSDRAEASLSQVLNQPWLYGRDFQLAPAICRGRNSLNPVLQPPGPSPEHADAQRVNDG